MLMERDVFGWKLAVDVEATARAYERLALDCTCNYCRNFSLAVATLPEPLLGLLHSLGIDPAKPANATEYGRQPNGLHMYDAFYHAVGTILDDSAVMRDQFGHVQLTESIDFLFTTRTQLVGPNFPQPALQLEVFFFIPWLLDQPPDPEPLVIQVSTGARSIIRSLARWANRAIMSRGKPN